MRQKYPGLPEGRDKQRHQRKEGTIKVARYSARGLFFSPSRPVSISQGGGKGDTDNIN